MVELQIPGTFIESQTSMEEEAAALVSWTNETPPLETRMIWDGGYLIDRPRPVAYEGGNPVIDPAAMMEERPYRVIAFGEDIWVVKSMDGTVAFYHVQDQLE